MRCARPLALALTPLVLAGCGGDDDTAATTQAPAPTPTPTPAPPDIDDELRALERRFDARVGLFAVDTGSGVELAHRAAERFPFASTFKAFAAGALLAEHGVDGMQERTLLVEPIAIHHSPVTEKRVGTRMSLAALARATVTTSDNTAGNMLLADLGGPAGLQRRLRALGDDVTKMDRPEPELNDWRPGERRDTSTPRAMARTLRAFVLGDALAPAERERLATWLKANTTGDDVIRAGVPDGWVVGDKTGTGGTYGTRNDIAVLWPPDGDPIVLALMTSRPGADDEPDDALLAEATRVVVDALRSRSPAAAG